MGRTKDLLGDLHITEEDILDELTSRNDDEYQYQKWLESEEFVEYVNREIDLTKPLYSE